MGWVAIYFTIGLVIGVVYGLYKLNRQLKEQQLEEQERKDQQYKEWL